MRSFRSRLVSRHTVKVLGAWLNKLIEVQVLALISILAATRNSRLVVVTRSSNSSSTRGSSGAIDTTIGYLAVQKLALFAVTATTRYSNLVKSAYLARIVAAAAAAIAVGIVAGSFATMQILALVSVLAASGNSNFVEVANNS